MKLLVPTGVFWIGISRCAKICWRRLLARPGLGRRCFGGAPQTDCTENHSETSAHMSAFTISRESPGLLMSNCKGGSEGCRIGKAHKASLLLKGLQRGHQVS